MFAIQWFHTTPCVSYGWLSRGKTYPERGPAEADAQQCAWSDEVPHRIIEQPSGRVVAVFGSTGKRLTFPIATAIAYAALAERMFSAGTEAGRAYQLAKCKHEEHKP